MNGRGQARRVCGGLITKSSRCNSARVEVAVRARLPVSYSKRVEIGVPDRALVIA